jgi:hypothetical protein
VVGAVAGGLAGKGVAEAVNPTEEDAYWRENYRGRDYVDPNAPYDTYRPAYQYGWESRTRYDKRNFDEVENDLSRDWDNYRGDRSKLDWDRAKHAARDAWERASDKIERAMPGDADRDGK